MSAVMRIRVEFCQGRAWEHPLALNGRKLKRVVIGGEEYVPLGFDLQEVFEDGKRVAIEFDGERFEPVRECCMVHDTEPRDTTMRVIGSCSECGHIICGPDWHCRHCGARITKEES